MHRTTINLDEAVYLRVRRLAQRKGRSLARTIEDLLRQATERPEAGAAPSRALSLHQDNGPRPGVDVADRDRLHEILDA